MTDAQIDDAERRRYGELIKDFREAMQKQASRATEADKAVFDTHRATIEQNKYPYKMPTNFERWMK